MKVKQFFFPLFMAAVLLSACGEKENCCVVPPNTDYNAGVYVVNEGPWGGSGTISWYNPETGEVQDSLFEKANNGAVLGQFVQSLAFHEGKAYIVVNGANRVVVVDALTFQYIDTIGGLAQPRFFLPLDENTAYVSQWGADGLTGSVAKVDLNTNEVLKTIATGRGPEKMLLANDRVYVANSGGYGLDSTITEILRSNDAAQILSLPNGKNPATLAWDNRAGANKLFYLCKGYFLDSNPEGRLNYVSNTGLGAAVPAYADDLMLDTDSGELYFLAANAVHKASPSGNDLLTSPLFSKSVYGLGFDTEQHLLYVADAKDFVSNGEVHVHRTDGTFVRSFRSGVAPGEIVIVK